MKIAIICCLMLVSFVGAPSSTLANSVTVRIAGQNLVSGTTERGAFFIVNLEIPEDVIGKRLDSVILEFYADVAADESIDTDYSSSIEVFPLTAPYQIGRSPVFSTSHPTSHPAAMGERQRVIVDIADIAKGWVATPSSNYGLVIGSFSGPRVGDLDLRTDVLEGGAAIQATFFYQNRFGQRLSQE